MVPIDLPSMRALPQFGGNYCRSMLWGSYRPGLYFGAWLSEPETRKETEQGAPLLRRCHITGA